MPFQAKKRKRNLSFSETNRDSTRPAPGSKDMSREKKFEKTEKIVAGPWTAPPLMLLERNALMAHPDSQPYILNVIQSPQEGRVNAGKPKGKPLACSLHPEPVLELRSGDTDPNAYHRSNPHFFSIVELVADDEVRTPVDGGLGGVLVSSLHKLKLRENQERAYFIFGDLCPKYLGAFRLKFVLFELRSDGAVGQYAKLLTSTVSQPFVVKEAKGVGISKASTPLTRAVAECGVKVRIRKEPTNKRKQAQTSWGSEQRPERPAGPVGFNQPQHGNAATARPMMPPTRGGENVMHRLTVQRNRLGHLDNQNFGDLRQHISNPAGIASWGLQPASVNHNPGFQPSQGSFPFPHSLIHGMNSHMNNNHMNNMASGHSTQMNNMTSGFDAHMNNSLSPTNVHMNNMISPTNAQMNNTLSSANGHINSMASGIDAHTGNMMSGGGSNAGNFAPLSQLSSLSSGSGQYDDMPATSMSYPTAYTASMPPFYNQQYSNHASQPTSVPPLYNQSFPNNVPPQGIHKLPLPNPSFVFQQNNSYGGTSMVTNG